MAAPAPLQRFLDPKALAAVSDLGLVARTVVDGFVAGLHRSPDFGFSQEFAEYQLYTPGDDLRHIDWNVFARTGRMYLKRFHGETNLQLTVLLDASASMTYSSQSLNKLDYARFVAASLCYMASKQRDAAGLVVFDDEVRQYVQPSSRQGQMARLMHAIGAAEAGTRTAYEKPFLHLQQFHRRRGIVVVISDFLEDPEVVVQTLLPLRFRGTEVVLFQVLDPHELKPDFRDAVVLRDLESGDQLEVTPDYARREYRQRMQAHLEALRSKAQGSGMDYHLIQTNQPLDETLRQYLSVRQGKF